ncbi:FKBP-type peptidyl-prolyl cis-trans isomerase [Granulosicoccus antarcticus]|uniref:Peptidyl-prolyl cis-trans isomerase n=1 Tax=Granulosicoccus antarcticus IMCC3135 TaxID=1192854 RepID=A0A2Z2NV11_9GAMM|nr:FKBP-type peptidyl-prolyl cis-trans isomerase [Granulosicoccus antarcticus]ASJ73558.1 putative FKBP-type peptidyl-prolyl cis-trans isomerase FkpA [Granulosicoccus antarcticus IMCC3135]
MKYFLILLVVGAAWYVAKQYMSNGKAMENIQSGQTFLDENGKADGVQSTASGLQLMVLEPGTGSTHPSASDRVTVHYHGTLIDGTVFDSSVERGEPITFGLNQVIPGWTEGLQLMVEGEKTRLFIPSTLAYGNRAAGKIEPGSTLIFDVELIGINAD